MEYCPHCCRETDSSRIRLVQDSCGHRKCRECLLSEEAGCLSCSITNNAVYTDLTPAVQLPLYAPSTPASEHGNPQTFPGTSPLNDLEAAAAAHFAPAPDMSSSDQDSPAVTLPSDHSQAACEDIANPEEENDSNEVHQGSRSEKKRPTYGLKDHIVFTPGNPPNYFCKNCQKSYNNRKAARYHNYCGASNNEKPHTCHVCGQGFVTKGHLAYHVKSHTGDLPYQCKACEKGFKQFSKLKRHMKSHEETPEKPFKCDLCEKRFNTKHILNDHKLTHSEGHFVSCPTCNKKLSSKSCLRKHKKIHQEPVHKCGDCGKKFTVKWSLDVHLKSHLRERKFKCRLCNRAFKIRSDLKRHAVVHQEDGEWDCNICSVVFRRRDNLVRHLKNIHPESPVNISLKQIKDVPESEENVSKTSTMTSHAVSVIRGCAVPVIQKAQTVLASGCLKSLTNTNQEEKWGPTIISDSAPEQNIIPSSKLADQSEFAPSTCQNFHRESVVRHSDAQGIVSYGSSVVENLGESPNFRSRHGLSAVELPKYDNQFCIGGDNSENQAVNNDPAYCAIQRRVIIEKNFICDSI